MEDLVDHTRSGVLWYRTNIGGGASDSYKLSTRATQWPSRGHIPAVIQRKKISVYTSGTEKTFWLAFVQHVISI